MKKVLILNPYVSTLGGGEKQMAHLCYFIENYFKKNVQIDILVFSGNNNIPIDKLMKQFSVQLECTCIKEIFLPHEKNKIQKIKNQLLLQNITKDYDLFINLMFLSTHIGRSKKNMYICMFPPKKLGSGRKLTIFKKILLTYYNYWFYNSYDAFMPNSQFTKCWLEKYWHKSKKNILIYPPVFSGDSVIGRYDENFKRNFILSVGRFFVASHCKRQLELVQFFVEHQDEFIGYEYHLAGMISSSEKDIQYVNKIKELAEQSGRIFIHANCLPNDLELLYRQAKIFWHATGYGVDEEIEPEKMEHFGITTAEAMSFGIVPVVINKGGQPEIVERGKSGCIWNNKDECIEETTKLINDDRRRREFAANAVERAKYFSTENFYLRNKEVFDELQV